MRSVICNLCLFSATVTTSFLSSYVQNLKRNKELMEYKKRNVCNEMGSETCTLISLNVPKPYKKYRPREIEKCFISQTLFYSHSCFPRSLDNLLYRCSLLNSGKPLKTYILEKILFSTKQKQP